MPAQPHALENITIIIPNNLSSSLLSPQSRAAITQRSHETPETRPISSESTVRSKKSIASLTASLACFGATAYLLLSCPPSYASCAGEIFLPILGSILGITAVQPLLPCAKSETKKPNRDHPSCCESLSMRGTREFKLNQPKPALPESQSESTTALSIKNNLAALENKHIAQANLG
ncbi:MAG: hypothetical protein Q7V63_04060 [Gammaproteobacteria bacterium]|nr:hypothetical protein [Gammaproteobacteria bacterium]